jgi:pseudouridine synthase
MPKHPTPRHADAIPAELTDASRGERLQKVLAKAGIASRRDCETMIEEGRVRVNGQSVRAMPAWVDPDRDRIEVDGKAIKGLSGKVKHAPTYILIHKPRKVISTTDDPQGRADVLSLLPKRESRGLFPVGRLDADSTGLMLLTDDGQLAHRIMHPSYEVAKEYFVVVRGALADNDLAKLREGLMLTDQSGRGRAGQVKRAAVEQIRVIRRQQDRQRGDRTLLSITLREGQNREIRRLLERRGVKVRGLKRVAIGPLRLKKLPVGQWRRLTAQEVASLKRSAGLQARR